MKSAQCDDRICRLQVANSCDSLCYPNSKPPPSVNPAETSLRNSTLRAPSRWLVFDDSFLGGVLIGHLLCAPKPSVDEYSLVVSVICHIHRISSRPGLFLGIAAGSPGEQSRKVCEEGTIC
jgi:hypothetical protein